MDWKTLLGFTILFHAVVYATRRTWILRLDTKRLNKCINGISTKKIRKYFRIWFRIGSYVTVFIGFPFTLWLFLRTIFHALIPSVAVVALAVTPTSFLSSSVDTLELHRDELSPYPDAEIPIETSGGSSSSSSSYLAIQPILPGWNLPLAQLPYYLIAILISVVVHELGHAVASASHRIPIVSMGVSLFGPLIPAAHVELNSAQLRETPFKKQLDILTAGVWMNMYLSLIAYFVMPWIVPALLFPTHSMGGGIAVTGVIASSGAGGRGGLERGDVIIGVESCPVRDIDSWLSCLESIWESDPVGYCLQGDTVAKYLNNSENPGCCGADQDTSPTHLCFLEMGGGETVGGGTEIHPPDTPGHLRSISLANTSLTSVTSPELLSNTSNNSSSSSYCLPAKPIVTLNETLSPKCYSPNYICTWPKSRLPPSGTEHELSEDQVVDDGGHGSVALPGTSTHSNCYLPRILQQYHSFRIIQIHRRQGSRKESVLFVGDVWDLRNGVFSSDYIPRTWWLSEVLGFSPFAKLPVHLETVLLLTAGLSAGLAVVNMLPIYGLDGYHVVEASLRLTIGKGWESRKISRLVHFISWASVFLALLTLTCSLVQSL